MLLEAAFGEILIIQEFSTSIEVKKFSNSRKQSNIPMILTSMFKCM